MENMRRVAATDLPKGPAGAVDFDELVQGAATNAKVGGGEAPQPIALPSLWMPPKPLRQLIAHAATAGGLVVFRGVPNNSMQAFSRGLGKIDNRADAFATLGRDPTLFNSIAAKAA